MLSKNINNYDLQLRKRMCTGIFPPPQLSHFAVLFILFCSFFLLVFVSYFPCLCLCSSITLPCLKHHSQRSRLAACGEKHLAVICHCRIKDVAFSCHSIKRRVPASEDAFSLIVPQSLHLRVIGNRSICRHLMQHCRA